MEAVILAAGLSRRLGGGDKLLLPVGGEPVLARTVRAVRAALPTLPCTVVVPATGLVRELAERLGVRVLLNPDAAEGVASSLRVAVRAAVSPPLLLFLGDQPFLSPTGIRAVLDTARTSPGLFMAAPWYRDVPGHPVLLGDNIFPALLELTGDRGARSLWGSLPERARRRLVIDAEPPPDLDTQEDYQKLLNLVPESTDGTDRTDRTDGKGELGDG